MSISLPQIVIIALIVILIFGLGKFPKVMENIAKGIKTFNKEINKKDDSDKNSKK